MKNTTKYIAAATAGLLVVTSVSVAAARHHTAREAAIHKCNAQALKQVPTTPGNNSFQQQRAAVWKDCMVNAGQRP